MPSNRINNNSETIEFMNLEVLVRVYFYSRDNMDKFRVEAEIYNKLKQLDEMRGYNFDTEAASKEILEQIKSVK